MDAMEHKKDKARNVKAGGAEDMNLCS